MHILVEGAGVVGFAWDALNSGSTRPGLLVLHHLTGPIQHFRAAIWDAWRTKVCFDLCRRQGFRRGPMLDIGHARGEIVPCGFCGEFDGDGHLFWDCLHPSLVQIRENPQFHDLIQRGKRNWPRCLLWHGWLPAPDGAGG